MKAMIFAAGLGTRLKPFTLQHPKALVPVSGVPMLERVLVSLKNQGIDEFVINVHHFAHQITDFLKANDNFGCKIHISDERQMLLDTGGGILAARRWLEDGDEPFVVHNVDILTNLPLAEIIEDHRHNVDCISTLLVAARSTSRYLLFDSEMRMRGWTNVSTGAIRPEGMGLEGKEKYAFGGVHVMSPKIFPVLENFSGVLRPFSITDFYIEACSKVDIMGYLPPQPYEWFDIGRPETIALAQKSMLIQ